MSPPRPAPSCLRADPGALLAATSTAAASANKNPSPTNGEERAGIRRGEVSAGPPCPSTSTHKPPSLSLLPSSALDSNMDGLKPLLTCPTAASACRRGRIETDCQRTVRLGSVALAGVREQCQHFFLERALQARQQQRKGAALDRFRLPGRSAALLTPAAAAAPPAAAAAAAPAAAAGPMGPAAPPAPPPAAPAAAAPAPAAARQPQTHTAGRPRWSAPESESESRFGRK